MQAILNSVLDGAAWIADTLDAMVTDTVQGFGAAAPVVADRSFETCGEPGDR